MRLKICARFKCGITNLDCVIYDDGVIKIKTSSNEHQQNYIEKVTSIYICMYYKCYIHQGIICVNISSK